MRSVCRIFITFLSLFCAFTSRAESFSGDGADGQNVFYAVMGDSVALGVWADSSVGHPGPNFYLTAASAALEAKMLAAFTGYKTNDLSNAEKYSTTIDHFFGYIARKKYSALIGEKAYSLPQRIRRATGKNVEVVDTSFLAGCYRLSATHLKRLRTYMQNHPGHRAPDFIFINFSAMDFVFNSSMEVFTRDLQGFYHQLTRDYPNSTIVVNSLVDVVSSMTSSLDEIAVPGNALMKPMTCAENYDRVGFGSIIGIKKGMSEQRLAELHAKLSMMNSLITNEVAAMNAHTAPYDKFNGKVVEIASFQPLDGNKWAAYLAADCIHPNTLGQKTYSDLVWAAVRDMIVSSHI